MGLFGFFKKSSPPPEAGQTATDEPYRDKALNRLYNLLFCDDLRLYQESAQGPPAYPFDILFSDQSSVADLQTIIDDKTTDTRAKILAYKRQQASGQPPTKKELLAVIVEVGLDEGLDVLASFADGTARYINQTGKLLVWENTTDAKANEQQQDLFAKSQQIVNQIGPWDKARKPAPAKGLTRISFLVSDGLYFGEAATEVLFRDQMAAPALASATRLMQYLTQVSLERSRTH